MSEPRKAIAGTVHDKRRTSLTIGKRGPNKRATTINISRNIARKYLTDGGLTPLDVMIGNMRFYAENAESYLRQLRAMLQNLDPTADKELFKECLNLVNKFMGARTMAHECAVDASPYMHPRYQQIKFDDDTREDVGTIIDLVIPLAGVDEDRAYRTLGVAPRNGGNVSEEAVPEQEQDADPAMMDGEATA